jgi:hypothetical protein
MVGSVGGHLMKYNDLFCVVFGCNVPLVFRRIEGDRYYYVGSCFVVGITGGKFRMARSKFR